MDLSELGTRQRELAADLLRDHRDGGWTQLKLFWSGVGGASAIWLLALDEASAITSLDPPVHLRERLAALKADMATAQAGTWVSVEVLVSSEGRYAFDFNYDRRVFWNQSQALHPYDPPTAEPPVPSDDLWLAEFDTYPRSADAKPEWVGRLDA